MPTKVKAALILAAGFGSRFIPYTYEKPKGLIEVKGEPLIERQIKQLHQQGITNVYLVVGYLKEHFAYLQDKYQVKLIDNPDYATKNNISSIYYAKEVMMEGDLYLLTSDVYYEVNPFKSHEPRSWYAVQYFEGKTEEWAVDFNDQGRITGVTVGGEACYAMYGPAFLTQDFSRKLYQYTLESYHQQDYYWENVFVDHMEALALYVNPEFNGAMVEFECFEDLVVYDPQTQNKVIQALTKRLDCSLQELHDFVNLEGTTTCHRFSVNHWIVSLSKADLSIVEVIARD